MKLIIVRHGQSNYNVSRTINFLPSTKCYLTAEGIKQAEATKEKLAASWDIVFVSELYRTQQTANILDPDASLIVDTRLNEINTGIEGQDYDEYQKQFDGVNHLEKRSIVPENGESYNQVKKRVKKFLDELKTRNFSTVLIVTHFVPMIAFRQLLEGQTDEESVAYRPRNAEIYIGTLTKSF